MSASGRLAVFAAALAMVFAASFGIGAAFGPEPDDAPAPAGSVDAGTDEGHVGPHGGTP